LAHGSTERGGYRKFYEFETNMSQTTKAILTISIEKITGLGSGILLVPSRSKKLHPPYQNFKIYAKSHFICSQEPGPNFRVDGGPHRGKSALKGGWEKISKA